MLCWPPCLLLLLLLIQVPLWGGLRNCGTPLLLVAGDLDSKFSGIKRRMMSRLKQGLSSAADTVTDASPIADQVVHHWAELPGVGHAVHIEAPLQLFHLVKSFARSVES